MYVELVQTKEQQNETLRLLTEGDLSFDQDITTSLLLKDEDEAIGTISLSSNIIKCLSVSEKHQKEGLALTLVSKAIELLRLNGIMQYFAYTKENQRALFESMGFTKIVAVDGVVLLEGGPSNIKTYLENVKKTLPFHGPAACIVMNLNPMTNGHLFLIEEAAKQEEHVYVFVVEEDLSIFPFAMRYEIAKEATKHLRNVTVLPSGPYMVSRSTFSTYFIKEKKHVEELHAKIDFQIFQTYYAPILNIYKRYIGTEPYCVVTNNYNQVMLQSGFPIQLIERLKQDGTAVSASLVREKLSRNEDIKELVPEACYERLRSTFKTKGTAV